MAGGVDLFLIGSELRGYVSEARFNPIYDLGRNCYGVLEFDGNKPELECELDCHLRARQEDANIIA